jgi:tetratricopeptide (TPR) repeat protein
VATQPAQAIEVFYSYSHMDEGLRDQLENHLAMLKRDGVIQGWHDRRISGGQEWEGEIDAHMKSADIILLLVSSDFLASNYCYDIEVTTAMERHEAKEARVIPIILRPCDWNTAPFGKLQALPKDVIPVRKWSDQDEAFLDIAKGIRRVAGEIRLAGEKESQPHVSSSPEAPDPASRLHIPDILRVEFVPRKDQSGDDIVARLKEELAPHKRRLVALWGAGGVGKTALAIETARGLTETFGHRVVWVSADGLKDFNLSTLLDAIATQLGQDDLRKLALEPKKEQVRAIVAAVPALIVLDNFETIEPPEAKQCAEWLAQPALCSALITTRDRVEDAARNIPVNTMRPEEAHNLLQQLIAQAHDPRAFARLDHDDLIQTAEANPLVLQWIVGQIDLAQDPQEVLDDLRQGEGTAAERVFDRSFRLKQLDNGGRAVLLALSLFAPSATRKALAAVSGLDKEKDRKRFKDAVRNLSALWLIRTTEDSPRLAVEGLTRELTKAHLSADPRNKTFRQRFTARFWKFAQDNQSPTPEHLNAMEVEKDNILSAMDVASSMNDWSSVMRLSDSVYALLTLHGYWDEAIRRGEQAHRAAYNQRDEAAIARFAHNTAITFKRRGEIEKARRLYDESLDIEKKLGNQSGIAISLQALGGLAHAQGELDEARRLYDESLEIAKRLGDQVVISTSLYNLAIIAQDQGELDVARRLYDESLEIKKKLGNQSGIAISLQALGGLAHDQGDLDEARRLYDESLEIAKRLGDQSGIAISLQALGGLAHAQGELDEARRLYDESLEIAKRLGDQSSIANTLHSLANLAEGQGDLDEARRLYDESLEIKKRLGDQSGIAASLQALGILAQQQGELDEARRLYDESLEITKRLGDQSGIAASLYQLGMVCLDEGNIEGAENLLNQSLIILRKLSHKRYISECFESIGRLRTVQGSFPEAHDLFNESLELALSLSDKYRVASVKRSLGLLAEKENEKGKAAELLREALSGFESLKSPKAVETRRDLERVTNGVS